MKKKRMLSAALSLCMAASLIAPFQSDMTAEAAAAAGSENVARGKTVTASEAMGDVTNLQLVTDGKVEEGWDKSFCYHTWNEAENTEIKPYVQIDLGETYEVNAVELFGLIPPGYPTYKNTAYNVVVQVSNDENFADDSTKTVFNADKNNFFGLGNGSDTDTTGSTDGRLIEFDATDARYVRYYQHGAKMSDHNPPGWINCLALSELKVYADTGEVTEPPKEEFVPEGNVAYNAKVTGSTYNSKGNTLGSWFGSPLSILTDGKLGGWCAVQNNTDGENGELVYVTLDLKKERSLNTILLWNQRGYNFTYVSQIVQISADGENWVNVYNSDKENRAKQDPSNSGELVCGGKHQNGTITGVKAGNDDSYVEDSEPDGKAVAFARQNARYIRWWCSGNSTQPNPAPQYQEIQAYDKTVVTFDFNDGSEPAYAHVNTGSSVSRPKTPVSAVPGKLFDKWTVGEAGGAEWNFDDPVTEDMTLVANWKDAAIRTVTFDTDGGTEIAPVQVTDSLTVARPENPEKEGKVFAGWKLDGAPYDFGAAVVADIVLKATWVDPATPNAFTIEAGLLDIVLDSHGNVTNLNSDLDGTDYTSEGPDGKLRSLVSLVADYQIETPTSLAYDETAKELVFGFASINAEARVALKDKGDYTSLTLTRVDKPDSVSVQAVLWGPIKTTITTGGQTVGTAYDDEYAIGMHMLNTKTIGGWPIEYKDAFYAPDLPAVNGYPDSRVTRNIYSNTVAFSTWGSALNAYSWDYTKDTMRTIAYFSEVPQLQPAMTGKYADECASMIGSSIALYGTRKDNILNVIYNIQMNEGLPHTTIDGGKWQKESLSTGQDFLVFNDAMWGLDVVENDAKMANAAGINYIYGQYGASGPWAGDGSYKFNGNFGGSDENVKKMVEKAGEYGVYIGTHTLSNLIDWNTEYMKPEATSALSYAGFAALTRDAAAGDTTLYVADGFPFSSQVVGASGNTRLTRIGTELVRYADCSQVSENEWKLTGVERGVNGTPNKAHKAGENAYKLWAYYTAPALGGWDSIEPITGRMGYVYSDLGVHCMSYDSFESTKFSVYSSMLPAKYMKSVWQNVKDAGQADGFITEASDMDTNVWDVHSRISWGESNTPIDAMMNYMGYYRQNFFPAMLGWMYDHGNHGGYGKGTLLMNLSMKGGWQAGAGWYVNRNTFKQYPYMADMLKTWNNAIQKGAFVVGDAYTEEIQAAMRNAWKNGRVWDLKETVADKEWVLQEVSKSNTDQKIGEPVTLYATNDIEMERVANGDVATNMSLEYSRAHAGDTVTVYAQPHTGNELVSVNVIGEDGKALELTAVEGQENVYTFTMPEQKVSVTGTFTEDTEENVFEITANGKTTTHHYNEKVTIEAPEVEGKVFAGWKVNGAIVSYDQAYTFYVSEDMDFTAEYADEAVEQQAKALLTNVFVTKRADEKSDVKFVGELVIPEGYKVVGAGLVWSSKDGTELSLDNEALKPTYISKISDTNQFSVTIKGMPAGRFLRGVIFAEVEDSEGNTKVIYSQEEKRFAAK